MKVSNTAITAKEKKAAYNKAYRASHKVKISALNKRWNALNKNYKNQWSRAKAANDPTYYRKYSLKHNYGITIQDYDNMLAKQHNRCAICHTHMSELTYPLHVDHKHADGKVRALLCNSCNQKLGEGNIGKFDVTSELYTAALNYILLYNN